MHYSNKLLIDFYELFQQKQKHVLNIINFENLRNLRGCMFYDTPKFDTVQDSECLGCW